MRRNRIDYLVGDETDSPPRLTAISTGASPISPIAPVRGVSGPLAAAQVAGGVQQPAGQPDCRRCQHFAVSWDPTVPYLCRAFGFKSRGLPSREVFEADGHPCRLFAARN
jgi:hypothetical protein